MSDFFGDYLSGGSVAFGEIGVSEAIFNVAKIYAIVLLVVYAAVRIVQTCDSESGPEFRSFSADYADSVMKLNAAKALMVALGAAMFIASCLDCYYFGTSPCGILLFVIQAAIFLGGYRLKRSWIDPE